MAIIDGNNLLLNRAIRIVEIVVSEISVSVQLMDGWMDAVFECGVVLSMLKQI